MASHNGTISDMVVSHAASNDFSLEHFQISFSNIIGRNYFRHGCNCHATSNDFGLEHLLMSCKVKQNLLNVGLICYVIYNQIYY